LGKTIPLFSYSALQSCEYSVPNDCLISLFLSGCWDRSTSDAKVLALVTTYWLGDRSYGDNSFHWSRLFCFLIDYTA